MMGKSTRYLSALGSDWLTPLYDPLQRWVMRERHFKGMLVAQAGVQSGHRVLDIARRKASRAAGFEDVSSTDQLNILFGTLEFLQAGKAP